MRLLTQLRDVMHQQHLPLCNRQERDIRDERRRQTASRRISSICNDAKERHRHPSSSARSLTRVSALQELGWGERRPVAEYLAQDFERQLHESVVRLPL